jgi:hypothetical protein
VTETLEDPTGKITEQQIGVRVFGRPSRYKPIEDHIVRNYARQLRRRLTEYFEREGASEALRIYIPVGGYVPVFVPASDAAPKVEDAGIPLLHSVPAGKSVSSAPPAAITPVRRRWDRFLLAGLLLAIYSGALVGVGWVAVSRFHPPLPVSGPAKPLWAALFGGPANCYIVPADVGINLIESLSHRPVPLELYIKGDYLSERLPLPEVDAQSADNFRSQQLTDFVDLQIVAALARLPEFNPERTILRFPRNLQLDEVKNANVIILGSMTSNPWAALAQSNANFRIVNSENMTGGVTYQYFLDGGFTNLGRQMTSPQYQNPTLWNPKVNYTHLVKSHTLKAGIEYQMLHVAQEDLHPVLGANAYDAQMSGQCYYGGCYKGYNKNLAGTQTSETFRMFDCADFLLGYQAEMGMSNPDIANIRTWGWAGYLQDDWRVTKRLTLNLGLRYEFFTPIYEANNHLANFNSTTQSIVVASSSNPYTVNPNTTDFGPRLGAAFTLDPRTVLRGGFGINYSHWNRVGSNYLTMSPPFGIVAQRVVYPSLPTYLNTQSGFPANLVNPANFNPTEDVLQYMPASSPDTQVRSWFFGVHRDLGHKWLLDVSYVGNSGIDEILINDINQATTGGTAALQSRVPNTNFGSIIGTLPWATSSYNSLQAKVEKRFSEGVYLLNSFTWSKAIDIAEQALDGGGGCNNCGNAIPSVQNIYDWQADRGIAGYNHPFVNTTSLVWSVPVGHGQWLLPNASRFVNEVLGGWQATDIFQTRSGDPLTFAYSPGNNNEVSALITVDGRNSYRPNQTGPAVAAHRTLDADGYPQYLNVNNFSTPSYTSPFGNSPRNAATGPGYWNFDMGLSKDFTVTEKTHLQFRAEAFNLLNHTDLGDPNTLLGGSFGEITSTLAARELQLAAKIVF